jgi:hypothetical protein
MFFVVAKNHPLPAKIAARLKTPYDRMVVGHRLVCLYTGFGSFLASSYWLLFIRDIECGKYNTLYETVLISNILAHFIWDCTFMQVNGFLDFGNLMHHVLGSISYSTGIYF